MDQLTHNVRRNSWLNIITECQRREAGEQMNLPAVTAPAELAFAEIPIPVSTPAKSVECSGAVAVIRAGSITLEVSNDISESLLRVLLQEVTHA